MVLPLQKLCLAALRDSLKDRPNPCLHEIPPPNHRQSLRQDLLDFVLAFGVNVHESAYSSLSSPEFLDGLSKFNTQRGITSDGEFLDLVADSFSLVQQNGKTIGEGITELKLNIYICENAVGAVLNLDSAVRVISQCLNLKILHLAFICDKLGHKRWTDDFLAGLPVLFGKDSPGGILNQPGLAPCLGVLENVEELSMSAEPFEETDWLNPSLVGKCPNFKFRCLASLHLTDFVVDVQAWKEIMKSIKKSLIKLELHGMKGHDPREISDSEFDSDEDLEAVWDKDWVLPFPLPNLRSFEMDTGGFGYQVIKKLMNSPKLEKIKMELESGTEREDAMRLLSRMNVTLELKIFLTVNRDRSNFEWVSLFKEKIKKMRFWVQRWTTNHSTALENLFATCPDLVEITFPPATHDEEEDEDEEDENHAEDNDGDDHDVMNNRLMAAVNSDLGPFLRDQGIVSKLRKLELGGPIDPAVLDALFENVTNLETLTMRYCPQFTDSHLQLWASRGGKPKYLHVWDCENITDHGLVPIFISSGDRLIYFNLFGDWSNRITEVTWRTLFHYCPFFDCPYPLLVQLRALFGSSSKCPEYLRW